jgi:acetoin utilization protein AcuB
VQGKEGVVEPLTAIPGTVSAWMTPQPLTVTPATSVLEARRLLRRYGIRHLPVVEHGRVVGMVSSRDVEIGDQVVVASLSALQSDLINGRYRAVETVMSAPAVVMRSTDTVADAARVMVGRGIGAVPVVDGPRLVGLLSIVDCVVALLALVPGEGEATPAGTTSAAGAPRG